MFYLDRSWDFYRVEECSFKASTCFILGLGPLVVLGFPKFKDRMGMFSRPPL